MNEVRDEGAGSDTSCNPKGFYFCGQSLGCCAAKMKGCLALSESGVPAPIGGMVLAADVLEIVVLWQVSFYSEP